MDLTALQYPIGRFVAQPQLTAARRGELVDDLAALPAALAAAVAGLTATQLDTPYRPQGWTVRQVVHHIPDSHLNAFVRCKLALTEQEPLIKPYDEAAWATLADAHSDDIATSLELLAALHRRWTGLLRTLTDEQWHRRFRHPDHGLMSLNRTLQLYQWHGRHHLAHITSLAERSGW
jgi:hypothetical protein